MRSAIEVRYVCVLLVATFLLGSSFVAAKILLNAGVPALLLAGWRFVLAALATLPLALMGRGKMAEAVAPQKMTTISWAIVFVIGLLQTTAVMGLGLSALRAISAQTTAILLFTNPVWVVVLSRIFLKESLNGLQALGMLLGITGVVLAIGTGGRHEENPGDLFGELASLASAICWASATIINKRSKLPIGPWALNFWQMSVGSIALLLLAYGVGERWPTHLNGKEWGWFLWLAIPASTGSFGLWFLALKWGGASRTSSYLFLAPLFTVVLAHFIFGSSFMWSQVSGGFVIGLAIWLVNRVVADATVRDVMEVCINSSSKAEQTP